MNTALRTLLVATALLGLTACSSSGSSTVTPAKIDAGDTGTVKTDTGTVKTDGGSCTSGVSGTCGTCVDSKCCTEVDACNAITGCMDCATKGTSCDATNQTAADAVGTCATNTCATECGPTTIVEQCTVPTTSPSAGSCVTVDTTSNLCNPVTNAGCNAATGEACDFDGAGGFKCWAPPPANTAAVCAACDTTNGPACMPTSTCMDVPGGKTACARFCCTDADCGTGLCDTTVTGGAPGVCVVKP
jgi:hypothetical protein